jgi:hypothetical protein
MRFVFRSPAFFVLLGIGMLNSFGSLWNAGRFYGGEVFPVTRLMADGLSGAFTMIPIIIAIYYGGELVWRDRERRLHEIVDATPAPDWAFMLPKMVAIALVLVATSLAAVVAAIGVQLAKGYASFEVGHYLAWFVGPATGLALLLAVLSVFVQVIVPHKFIGWGVMLLYLVASVALANAGFEHHLYNYASVPDVPLSDMNGTGRFGTARNWLFAYWSAFALLLAVLAYGLWQRGVGAPLTQRLRLLPARLRGRPAWIAAVAVVAWAGIGGWIFYNTNVLNEYVTAPERERRLAELEKALIGFEDLPQPRIVDVKLEVELFPNETRARTRGSYLIENRTGQPLAAMHLRWPERRRLDALNAAPRWRRVQDHHYRIYRFDPPLAPGEQRTVTFATTLEERGFPNSRPLTRIVGNGTFIDNTEITPSLGMSRDGLLQDRSKRRKHGLPAERRPAPLEDESARSRNALRSDSDWVTGTIVVTTDADQTPVAPGTRSDTTTGPTQRELHRGSDPELSRSSRRFCGPARPVERRRSRRLPSPPHGTTCSGCR